MMDVHNFIYVFFLSFFALSAASKNDVYSGYTVHGVEVKDRGDQEILQEMVISLDVDLWQYGFPGVRDAIVMVASENKDEFLKQLDDNGISHYLHIEDVTSFLNEQDLEVSRWRASKRNAVPFEDYPRYHEIDAYLERIASQYPEIVTIVNSGPSFEGRSIKYLKISTTNFTDTSKPIYFMNAMLHAREWVTAPVALYSIHRLVEDLRSQDRDLLDNIDWIIMPLVNADGYEYSHIDRRLWRRTRSFNPAVNLTCYGVDANRNFNVSHNTIGISSDPCSDVYPGHIPFSERETGYVRDILHEYIDRIQLYLDIHSHGNYVLYAYGDRSLPPNALDLHHVGAIMGAAIDVMKLPQAGFYLVGNSALVLYGSSGSAQDYGQHVGVPFSYTLELPGYGYAFSVPPRFIAQINEETWLGIAASARVSLQYYRARLNISN
ncbi:PREDICTED: carboxypeptidase B-like [Papilio polytes]|uniref:carboxypeptidase B-like n=1 Tax=Papilio polytes TaxID=76194 RepID=UPI0006765A37|nr:PREDICTED: carboxypeptidase B-like [Papilio polytes]